MYDTEESGGEGRGGPANEKSRTGGKGRKDPAKEKSKTEEPPKREGGELQVYMLDTRATPHASSVAVVNVARESGLYKKYFAPGLTKVSCDKVI